MREPSIGRGCDPRPGTPAYSPEELLAERPETRYLPPDMVRGWFESQRQIRSEATDPAQGAALVAARRELLRALAGGGARVLLGTDSPQLFSVPGFSIHREMQAMVESGMTPWQVLAAGTRDVAIHLGESSESGTVEIGRRADLLLLEADPLADVAHVARRAGPGPRSSPGPWSPAAARSFRGLRGEVRPGAGAVRPRGTAATRHPDGAFRPRGRRLVPFRYAGPSASLTVRVGDIPGGPAWR